MAKFSKWCKDNLAIFALLGMAVAAASAYFVTRTYADATYSTQTDVNVLKTVVERIDRNTARWCERTSTDPRKDCQ